MIPIDTEKIAIQDLLANVSEELESLSCRLKNLEAIIFDRPHQPDEVIFVQEMQDMDLIIQQISDLSRAIRCVVDVRLDDAMLQTSALGDKMHLNDLRQRLLGFSDDRIISAPKATEEVLLF